MILLCASVRKSVQTGFGKLRSLTVFLLLFDRDGVQRQQVWLCRGRSAATVIRVSPWFDRCLAPPGGPPGLCSRQDAAKSLRINYAYDAAAKASLPSLRCPPPPAGLAGGAMLPALLRRREPRCTWDRAALSPRSGDLQCSLLSPGKENRSERARDSAEARPGAGPGASGSLPAR